MQKIRFIVNSNNTQKNNIVLMYISWQVKFATIINLLNHFSFTAICVFI